jgi:hypothetical protein
MVLGAPAVDGVGGPDLVPIPLDQPTKFEFINLPRAKALGIADASINRSTGEMRQSIGSTGSQAFLLRCMSPLPARTEGSRRRPKCGSAPRPLRGDLQREGIVVLNARAPKLP